MNFELVHSENSSRLILVFAGWGYDIDCLGPRIPKGYDIMVIRDYATFHIDWSCAGRYSEICLFAFSTGVYVASQTTQAIDHKITLRVAVNGTMHPVDNRLGIPEEVFFSAIDNPSTPPSVRQDIDAIYNRTILDTPSDLRWDIAAVGRKGGVFPRFNQMRAWQQENVDIQFIDEAAISLPGEYLCRFVIDKPGEAKRIDRVEYLRYSAIQFDIAEHLVNAIKSNKLVSDITAAMNTVLEVGSAAGILSSRVATMIDKARLLMLDSSADIPAGLPVGRDYAMKNCSPEVEISRLHPASIDHIFSSSVVQTFNAPEKFLIDCKHALRPGGYLFLTTFTAGHLHEISDMTGRSLPLLSVEKWIEKASRHFEVVYHEAFVRDLDFETPKDALSLLKSIGWDYGIENDDKIPLQRYPMRLDGRYHLTFNPLILILHKK